MTVKVTLSELGREFKPTFNESDDASAVKFGETVGKGDPGEDGLTPEIKDGYWWIGDTNTGVRAEGVDGKDGADGKDGRDGEDGANGVNGVGVKSIEQTTTSIADGGNNVFTVTLTNGNKSTFTVKNGSKGSTGAKGDKGEKGDTGATGLQGVKGDKGEKGATGANGKDGKDGYTPQKGVDYFTEAEKVEMVNAVRAQLISEQWTLTLMDGSVVTKDVIME